MKSENFLDLDFKDVKSSFELDRREFVKLLGGGLLLLFTVGDSFAYMQEQQRRRGGELPTDFNAFLHIGENGRVTCFTGKIEMGQGVITSLAQELADELDVSLDSVDMVMGDTDLCPWDMGTFGSMTTRFFGPPLRAAGAEAKKILLEMASEKLKKPVNQLIVKDGIVSDRLNKKNNVSYAQLAKGKKIEKHLKGKVEVKTPKEFKIINRPFTRHDSKLKVTGKAKYSADILLPEMLYAKILRPPAHGAKLINADLSEAKKIEGVVVVEEKDLIAVLHKYPDVAQRALEKIKANFSKSESTLDDKNIFDHLLKFPHEERKVAEKGSLKTGEENSPVITQGVYYDGYKAHSPIEPHAAVAKIEGKKITVWGSTQNPFTAKEEVANALGIPSDNVRLTPPFLGGGFGGKTMNRQIVEAARLTKITGKPVMVNYTREEEFFYDAFRPAAVVKIKSGCTKEGKINLWDYQVYFAGERGADPFYDLPNSLVRAYNSARGEQNVHPFATGPWRAPGNNTNTFARESQMDIMAAKIGMDPVEFRLKNLKDKKMIDVLNAAAKKFGWKNIKPPSGKGYGVALGIDAGTYVAMIAKVNVNKDSGNVKVERVVCAQDMGLVINPEGAAIQMEGCIMMGLGYTLSEDLKFKNGEILDKNFDTYEIPRFEWLPKIEMEILHKEDEPPQGGGEPAIVTVGAAIANAIFDAAGIRLNQMPMNPDRIKAALAKK